MKVGMRKPSVKKSIKARTTGKAKRAVKKAVFLDMGRKDPDGLKIRKRLRIIKSTIKQLLV